MGARQKQLVHWVGKKIFCPPAPTVRSIPLKGRPWPHPFRAINGTRRSDIRLLRLEPTVKRRGALQPPRMDYRNPVRFGRLGKRSPRGFSATRRHSVCTDPPSFQESPPPAPVLSGAPQPAHVPGRVFAGLEQPGVPLYIGGQFRLTADTAIVWTPGRRRRGPRPADSLDLRKEPGGSEPPPHHHEITGLFVKVRSRLPGVIVYLHFNNRDMQRRVLTWRIMQSTGGVHLVPGAPVDRHHCTAGLTGQGDLDGVDLLRA